MNNDFPRMPDAEFSCPLSSNIPWYWGLKYVSCPVNYGERDTSSCANCPLKGVYKAKEGESKEERKRPPKKDKRRDNPPTKKEKTYVSK